MGRREEEMGLGKVGMDFREVGGSGERMLVNKGISWVKGLQVKLKQGRL